MATLVIVCTALFLSSLEAMPRNATNQLIFSDVKMKAAIEIKAVEGPVPGCDGSKECNKSIIQETLDSASNNLWQANTGTVKTTSYTGFVEVPINSGFVEVPITASHVLVPEYIEGLTSNVGQPAINSQLQTFENPNSVPNSNEVKPILKSNPFLGDVLSNGISKLQNGADVELNNGFVRSTSSWLLDKLSDARPGAFPNNYPVQPYNSQILDSKKFLDPNSLIPSKNINDQEELDEGSNLQITEVSIVRVNPVHNETLVEKVMSAADNKVLSEMENLQNVPEKMLNVPGQLKPLANVAQSQLIPKFPAETLQTSNVQDTFDPFSHLKDTKEPLVDIRPKDNDIQEELKIDENRIVKESERIKKQVQPKKNFATIIGSQMPNADIPGGLTSNVGQPAINSQLQTFENLNSVPNLNEVKPILKANPFINDALSNGISKLQNEADMELNNGFARPTISWLLDKLSDARPVLEKQKTLYDPSNTFVKPFRTFGVPSALNENRRSYDSRPILEKNIIEDHLDDDVQKNHEEPHHHHPENDSDQMEQSLTLHVPKNESIDLPISAPRGIKKLNLHIVLDDVRAPNQSLLIQMDKPKSVEERNIEEPEEPNEESENTPQTPSRDKNLNVSVVLYNDRRNVPSFPANYMLQKEGLAKQQEPSIFKGMSNALNAPNSNELIAKDNAFQELFIADQDPDLLDRMDLESLNESNSKLPLIAVGTNDLIQSREYSPKNNLYQSMPLPYEKGTWNFNGPPRYRFKKNARKHKQLHAIN